MLTLVEAKQEVFFWRCSKRDDVAADSTDNGSVIQSEPAPALWVSKQDVLTLTNNSQSVCFQHQLHRDPIDTPTSNCPPGLSVDGLIVSLPSFRGWRLAWQWRYQLMSQPLGWTRKFFSSPDLLIFGLNKKRTFLFWPKPRLFYSLRTGTFVTGVTQVILK